MTPTESSALAAIEAVLQVSGLPTGRRRAWRAVLTAAKRASKAVPPPVRGSVGRPRKVTPEAVRRLRGDDAAPQMTHEQIAAKLGVAVSTVHAALQASG